MVEYKFIVLYTKPDGSTETERFSHPEKALNWMEKKVAEEVEESKKKDKGRIVGYIPPVSSKKCYVEKMNGVSPCSYYLFGYCALLRSMSYGIKLKDCPRADK